MKPLYSSTPRMRQPAWAGERHIVVRVTLTGQSPITTLRFDLNPESRLRIGFRGDAHIAKANYEQAISDCSKALNLSPNDPIAYFTRANAHLFSGELELALSDFNAAIEFDPTSGRSIHGRGLVHELMGEAEGAEEDYRRARDLGYNINDLE